jgi:hypothetical protein
MTGWYRARRATYRYQVKALPPERAAARSGCRRPARRGRRRPDRLERLLATQLRAAGRPEPELTAAGLLALTNGLGSSMLGGQRDGDAAVAVLRRQLDRVFGPQ